MKSFDSYLKHGATRLSAAALVLLLLAGPFAPNAHAQLAKLEKGTLIEGLRTYGLSDLLQHLVDTELDASEQDVALQITANLKLIEYDELQANATDSQYDEATQEQFRQQAITAFNEAIAVYRRLIEEFYDHAERPIWQTQLAQNLIETYLRSTMKNAPDFYDFGVPTREQKAAFESAVGESLRELEDANQRFSILQSSLAKLPDHEEVRINTGLWDRMIRQYYQVRTQYMLGVTRYYASLLPDEHPYFRSTAAGERDSRVVSRERSIDAERKRLRESAVDGMTQLLTTAEADYPNLPPRIHAYLGLVETSLARYPEAEQQFTAATKESAGDFVEFMARIGEAFLVDAQGDQAAATQKLLDLAEHDQARQHLLMRLLLVDARHRILRQHALEAPAEERPALLSASYGPYQQLFDSMRADPIAEPLKLYVYRRWMDGLGDGADLSDEPGVVVSAVGEMLRVEGQNTNAAAQSAEEGSAEKATLRAEADQQLDRAVAVNSALAKREDVTPAVRAAAMRNYGHSLALRWWAYGDLAKVAEAAGVLIAGAQNYPEQAVSREAIDMGSLVAHVLYEQQPGDLMFRESYIKAMDVLLANFPNSPAAARERFFYAERILSPSGRYDESVSVLSALTPDDDSFIGSRRELLYAMLARYQAADDDAARANLASQLESQIENTLQAIANTPRNADNASILANVEGHTLLVRADLLAAKGDLQDAVDVLAVLESQFVNELEILRLGVGKRIVYLARMDEQDRVRDEAQSMMARFPDDAAYVINVVLNDIDDEVQRLRSDAGQELSETRRRELLDSASVKTRTAVALGQLLYGWAQQQDGINADGMISYELLLARAERLNGDPQRAVELLQRGYGMYPQDVEILHELGEAYYALGGDSNLKKAAGYFNVIAANMQRGDNGQYPKQAFNAWMRWFQINDKLGNERNAKQIPILVRRLQNEADEQLGGEPYRSEMLRLANKYR